MLDRNYRWVRPVAMLLAVWLAASLLSTAVPALRTDPPTIQEAP